jgi:hypothetical protein
VYLQGSFGSHSWEGSTYKGSHYNHKIPPSLRGGEGDVVNIEQQVSSVGAVALDEHQGVRLGLHEAQGDQVGEEAVVPRSRPCSRRLLQAVEGLVEPVHQLRVCGVNKAGGLRAGDSLEECAVEKGILDV